MDNKIGQEVAQRILKKGGAGILPTDTIYGLVGSALSKKAVARIYRLRRRNQKKPMIVLIGSLYDLKKFAVKLAPETKKILNKFWPGKASVILPCAPKKFSYLHRGTKTLAFRLPRKKDLRTLLKKTGPLVAPSANVEGKPPATTVKKARKYFGDKVDFYVDGGTMKKNPSMVIKIESGVAVRLR